MGSLVGEIKTCRVQVHVSYLEIYNEVGYDLLDPDRDVRSLEDLPRVHVMEDDDGAAHMRNLSSHRAASEEDALNLVSISCARFQLQSDVNTCYMQSSLELLLCHKVRA